MFGGGVTSFKAPGRRSRTAAATVTVSRRDKEACCNISSSCLALHLVLLYSVMDEGPAAVCHYGVCQKATNTMNRQKTKNKNLYNIYNILLASAIFPSAFLDLWHIFKGTKAAGCCAALCDITECWFPRRADLSGHFLKSGSELFRRFLDFLKGDFSDIFDRNPC